MHFSGDTYNQEFSETIRKALLLVAAIVLVEVFLPATLSAQNIQTFTSDGTFTVPAGVTEITVQAWGGGGGAGNQNDRCGGGGGGAFAESTLSVIPGSNYTITVGLGGSLENPGGNSSFGTLVIAVGGSAGNNSGGGAGGNDVNCTGTITYSGGDGGNGRNNGGGGGGGGSAYPTGDGGDGSRGEKIAGGNGGIGTGVGGNGGEENGSPESEDGNSPGGGGGGRGAFAGSSSSGADGLVIVSWNTSASYCPAGSYTCDEFISNVQVGSIDNNNGVCSTGGYFDYTAQSTDMEIGTGYPITVINGNDYTGDQCGIWVDWNADGDFDDANETITVTDANPTWTATITPPAGASIGSTRMRIRILYTGIVDPCGIADWGEVEDYSINVTAPTSPVLSVSPGSLGFGQVLSGNTSAEQTYTLSGLLLTGAPDNIAIVAPTDFEVSLTTGTGFGSSVSVPYSSSTLSDYTVYVRFAPTSEHVFYDSYVTNSGGGTSVDLNVLGNSDTYCPAGSNTCDEFISNVQIGSIDNNNGTCSSNGFADYTSQSTDMEIGTGYPITVTNGNNYIGDQCGIWVDWNADGDFDDANESITVTDSNPIFTATITPPAGASIGSTRMRIRIMYTGVVDPCGIADWGEVEDYTLNIIPPVSVSTDPISPLSYCPGSSVSVPYSITGSFNAGNVFTVQLSNENGSFASPTNIGSVTSQSSGTISAAIPSSGIVDGNGYRIRVVSSNPVFTGTNNGSDISIGSPELVTSPGSQCKYGSDVTVSVSASSSQSGIFRWYSDAAGTNLLQESTSSETSSEYTVTISSSQTYYVEIELGGCSSARIPVTAHAIVPPTLNATAGGTFCQGETVYLYSDGSGYDNIYWEGPNSFYSTDEDPVINNATAGMSGTYTVYTSTLSGVNLVTNGDFEEGNVGFTSEYVYHDSTETVLGCFAQAPLGCEGTYSVVANPNNTHPNFYTCEDKTTGGTFQMVINGAVDSVSVWSQTVNVVPNTYYQFSYWVQSVELNNPSQLQLYVNGVKAGPVYTADAATCNWTQFFYNWDSGSATTATLSLVNKREDAGGNDFALDDIVFQHTCTAEASVEVTVGSGFTPDVTISADPGETICDGDLVTFTATPINGGTNPTYQWYLDGVEITGQTSDTYATNSITDGDNVSCEMTSNLTCISGSATVTSTPIQMTVVPPPTASAGANLTSCGTAVVITNDATASEYNNVEWTTSGSGTFSDATSLTACTYTPSAADIAAGSVTLTLTAYGNTPCGNAVSTKGLNFADPIDVVVTANNSNYCPQFLPPVSFNNDDDPRPPGYTEVEFTVTRTSTSAGWTIFTDFTVTAIPALSGLNVENIEVADEGGNPISVIGTNQYDIDASNDYVTVTAQMLNQPGHSLEVILEVDGVEDANSCTETVTTNNDAVVDIYPMPAIGKFE